MIFSPIPGTPLITQGFGQNPDHYKQFGFLGHEGIDFGIPEGTIVYAPHDGIASVKDHGNETYGLCLTIEDPKRKSQLCHLSEVLVKDGDAIYQGNPVAKSGKSGNATAAHLHWTFRIMKDGKVQNKDNGYNGAVDISECTRLWLEKDLHHDSTYTDEAKPYLSMTFAENQYLKNPVKLHV